MVIPSGREKIRDGSLNIQIDGSLGNTADGGGFDKQDRTGDAETESHERTLTVAIVRSRSLRQSSTGRLTA